MSNELPDLIDPWRAVAQARKHSGCIAIDALPRLRSLVAECREELSYSLSFGRDDAHRAVVRVRTRGLLRLQCQRCLQPMDWPVDETTVLALVQGLDEAAGLPDHYDPLMLEEPLLRARTLIEDEVLLAIPAIARHETCDMPESHPASNFQAQQSQTPKECSARECLPEGNLIESPRGGPYPWAGMPTGLPVDRTIDEPAPARSDDASPFAILADWKASRG